MKIVRLILISLLFFIVLPLLGLYVRNVSQAGNWDQIDLTLSQSRTLANCWVLPGEPQPEERIFCRDFFDGLKPELKARKLEDQLKGKHKTKQTLIGNQGFTILEHETAELEQLE